MSRAGRGMEGSIRGRGPGAALRRVLVGVAIVSVAMSGLLSVGAADAAQVFDAPHLTLDKSDAPSFSTPPKVGDQITYSFTVSNDGNAALSDVAIDDALPGLSPITYTWPGASGVLDPGESATATATYLITQSDINDGGVINSATASGTTAADVTISSADVRTATAIDRVSSLTLVKSADASGIGTPAQPGEPIVYSFTVTNTGNITIVGVTVIDQLAGLLPLTYAWPGVAGRLDPNQSMTATATYPITAADVTADQVVNTAIASGTDVAEGRVTSDPATVTTPLTTPAPHLALVKTASTAFGALPVPGDLVTFSFTITNDGNVPLSGIQITDGLAGLSTISYTWPGATGALNPNESATATATYAITQGDIDSGSVANSATASGLTDTGTQVPSNEAHTATPIAQKPGIALTKTADSSGVRNPTGPGDPIVYGFVITNTGNVTLTRVEIADQLAGLPALTYAWPDTAGVLAPKASATATSTYAVTATDIASGTVVNEATASGVDPVGARVGSAPASTTTPLHAAPPTSTRPPSPAAGAEGSLADTGSPFPVLPLTIGTLLVAVGLALVSLRRPRRDNL